MSEITVPQLIKSEKLRNSDFEKNFDNGTILKIPYEIKQTTFTQSVKIFRTSHFDTIFPKNL